MSRDGVEKGPGSARAAEGARPGGGPSSPSGSEDSGCTGFAGLRAGGEDPSSLLVARQVVATLLAEGVGEVLLCPGSRSAPLALALAEAAEAGSLRLRVVLDERSAGFMALGIARAHALDGRLAPAAVVTTSGTAVPNLHPAACEADAAGVPLLLVCADRPHELVGTGANQTTHQASLFGETVRTVVDIPADLTVGLGQEAGLAAVAGQVRRGVAVAAGALSQDPGPVLVNVRLRPPLAPSAPWEPGRLGGTCAGPAARVIEGGLAGRAAGRPGAPAALGAGAPGATSREAHCADGTGGPRETPGLVVAGDTPHPATGRLARVLAERLGWPLLAEPTSHARGGACALTRYAELLATAEGAWLAEQVQHVVVAGHPSLSRPVTALLGRGDVEVTVLAERARWTDVAGTASAVVPVDVTVSPARAEDQVDGLVAARGLAPAAGDWLRSWHQAVADLPPVRAGAASGAGAARGAGAASGAGAAAQAALACGAAQAGKEAGTSEAPDEPSTVTTTVTAAVTAAASAAVTAVDAGEVVTAVWDAATQPGAPRLVVGSSTTVRRLDRLAPAVPPDRIPLAVANRGLAGIDGTVATAVGLALASGVPVRAVMGDLSFLHDAMSLGRGRAEIEPDLQVVVLDDAGGAIFRELEYAAVLQEAQLERLFGAPQRVDIPGLARATGAHVHVPTGVTGLRGLLAQPVRGVSVVVVQLARTASVRAEASVFSGAVTG